MPRWRSPSSAKSTIMMPFFFTMPISRMMPMIATTLKSCLKRMSDSSAPTPAEGKVERMVMGWMKLSYSTPRTMYTVTRAARISRASLPEEFSKAAAVPWKLACTLAGKFISLEVLLIASMAWPSEALSARLNETVTEGNWPWGLIESDSVPGSIRVKAPKGTPLLGMELVLVLAELDPVLLVVVASAFAGGVRIPEDGVKRADSVVALEPAEAEAEAEKEVLAAAPEVPDEALPWM